MRGNRHAPTPAEYKRFQHNDFGRSVEHRPGPSRAPHRTAPSYSVDAHGSPASTLSQPSPRSLHDSASAPHPASRQTPPKGVMMPRLRMPLSASAYRLPEN